MMTPCTPPTHGGAPRTIHLGPGLLHPAGNRGLIALDGTAGGDLAGPARPGIMGRQPHRHHASKVSNRTVQAAEPTRSSADPALMTGSGADREGFPAFRSSRAARRVRGKHSRKNTASTPVKIGTAWPSPVESW